MWHRWLRVRIPSVKPTQVSSCQRRSPSDACRGGVRKSAHPRLVPSPPGGAGLGVFMPQFVRVNGIPTKYIDARVEDGEVKYIYITHGTMTLAFTKENGTLEEFIAEMKKVVLEYIEP